MSHSDGSTSCRHSTGRARSLGAGAPFRLRCDGIERSADARCRTRQARNRNGAVHAHVAHPRTVHVAPWLALPELEPPLILKPRFGSWGRDVIRCDDAPAIEETLVELETKPWHQATGAIAQKLVAPRGYDLRILVAGGRVIGAVRRIAATAEWRTNVALGARREPVRPPREACSAALALAAAAAVEGSLVGVDLLPADLDTWVVLEVNGAVDFNAIYSLGDHVFSAAQTSVLKHQARDTNPNEPEKVPA